MMNENTQTTLKANDHEGQVIGHVTDECLNQVLDKLIELGGDWQLIRVKRPNNIELHGFVYQNSKVASPTIYYEQIPEEFWENQQKAANYIWNLGTKCATGPNVELLDNLRDATWVNSKLYYRVYGEEYNQALKGKGIVHLPKLKLILVPYILVNANEDTVASIPVSQLGEKLLDDVNLDFEHIKNNTLRLFPLRVETMKEMLTELLQNSNNISADMTDVVNDASDQMLVATNYRGLNGAATAILSECYKDCFDKCIVIPSSIHEILIIDANSIDSNIHDMVNMVREINRDFVSQEEVLANCVYYYEKGEELQLIDGNV